ncbi:MAG TPA: serine hydrolase [Chloroflexota bacterium]|nr:serine hydrolase [Chloroflexota bacterium]
MHIIPEDPAGYRRLSTHAVALVAVVGVAVGGMMTAAPVAEMHAASDVDVPSQVLPAQVALDLPSPTLAPTPPQRTQGADQRQAVVVFNPSLGLPQWLRTTQDALLWNGSDSAATSLGALPAGGAYVKPLGPFVDNRVEVYFPGDASRPAAQAWVDTTTVQPSGIPPWIAPAAASQTTLDAALPAPPRRVDDTPAPDTTAIHIAIVDDSSGQLLYSEQPYTEVPQASTTKIATTIVALERAPDLRKRIPVTVSAMAMVARDGSSTMGIEPGKSVSLDTLLHGMMLPSGNDAAEQVAVSLADSREQYIEWMNQEALALGLKDTHFVNPSGMDAAGHYSSAYDMAMLARYAMHNATFRDLAGATRYTGDGFQMQNLNRLLDQYPGADGVKIGFTDAAQKTIVASAVHDGHRVYVSLMHSEDLVGDSSALFDWVWASFTW